MKIDPPSTDGTPQKLNLVVFLSVLLLPAALTLLSGAAGKGGSDATGYLAMCGSGVSGLCCGFMIARRVKRTMEAKVILTIVLGAALGSVSFVLSFFGCALGVGLSVR